MGPVVTRNLFLPRSIGGMGVLPPIGFKYKVTSSQKRLAHYHLKDAEQTGCYIDTQSPLRGYDIREVEEITQPWDLKASLDMVDRFNLRKVPVPTRTTWSWLKKGIVLSSPWSTSTLSR